MPTRFPDVFKGVLRRRPWSGYAIAVATTAAATLLRFAVDPLLGNRAQFVTFFIAVVVTGAVSGRESALAATVLSTLAVTYCFIPPRWSFFPLTLADVESLAMFAVGASFIGWIAGRMHAAQREASRRADAARASEQRLGAIVGSAMDAIISINSDQRITLFNDAAEKMFGYPADRAVGQPLETLIPERFRAAHQQHVPMFATAGVTSRKMGSLGEISGLRANGEEFPIEASISHVDVAGQKVLIVILRDISERKRAETQRMESQEQIRLAKEAAERTAEELARSNRDLEQFAYVASHDLQEPLRMVAGYMQLLSDRYKGKLDEKADTFIDYAVDGAARMSVMIRDLLAFSRVNTRGDSLQLINVEEALDLALRNLRAAINSSGAAVTHDPLPTVRGDKTQLVQLFQNLVGNAIKFCSPDRSPVIHVSARRDEGHWLFTVYDNGIGFEQQYEDKMFLLFQRLHGRGKYPGTGIGLAICKRIVERHGGRIWATGQPGKGATFCFTMPG